MTKSIRLICLLLFLLSLVGGGRSLDASDLPEPVQQQVPTGRRQILVLKTYQFGLPIPDSFDRGILAAMSEGGVSASDIFIEHLDFARTPDSEHRANVAKLLRHKLAGKHFGVVIVEGDPAVNFATRDVHDLFPDAALLTLVTPGTNVLRSGTHKVLDIPWRVDIAGTLRAALDLFPKTRRIVVVTGARDGILPFLDEARKALTPWSDKLAFEYTNEMTYEEMLRRISTLPPDAIVIYSPYFTDTTGRLFVPAEVADKVGKTATAPVFTTLEAFLGHGIVGGSLLETREIGKQAGKIALDYLNGRLKLVKPVTIFETPTQMMFDWRELIRWKADISRLPTKSIIINQPLTLWGQYKGKVITAAAVFLALSILLVALLILNRRLRHITIAANDSEARFRVMVERAPEAIIVYDIDLKRIVDANMKAELLFGCNREKLLAGGPERFYVPRDSTPVADSVNDHCLRALAGEEGMFEQSVRSDDGRDMTCEVRIVQLPYREQRLVRCSFTDISERKQAEESLRASEAKFRTFVEHSFDVIFVLDAAGVFRFISPSWEKHFGFPASEAIGHEFAPFVHPDDVAAYAEYLMKILSTGEGDTSPEYRVRHADGSWRMFMANGTRYTDENGSAMYIGVGHDITDQKQAEDERLSLERQLLHAQKLESLGVLAGGIAHDFNNILMAIIGNADLALMRINPESPAVDNVRNIEKAAARAADLAKQMLAYSGKGKFVVENHDINDLLEEMLHILQISISKMAVLRLNLTRPLPPVEGDATQIRQIIMNLVINASEAIGEKSGIIAITTGCMDCDHNYLKDVWLDENINEGLYVYIEIADTGCGMDKEVMAKLFDPFFTTKFTGRGLGMAAVLGIVRGHKGAIKVYSEPGKGSTFKILLPASGKPFEIFNHDSTTNNNWKGSGTVLLVDDEETVRGIGREMLKELGFDVVTANDGREALEVYKAGTDISVIILDLTMPHMDGEQCFRELRILNPDIKVIMSSGFSEPEVTQKFVGKGLAGFIQKPYKLSLLRNAIMKLYH